MGIKKYGGGRVNIKDVFFLETRGAIQWPFFGKTGCGLICGLAEEAVDFGEHPIVVLAEYEFDNSLKTFKWMTTKGDKFAVKAFFAEMSTKVYTDLGFRRYCNTKKPNVAPIMDTEGFPDITDTFEEIDEMGERGLISIPKETQLYEDMKIISGNRLFGAKTNRAYRQNVPALACFCDIVTSYRLYPYEKPARQDQSRKSGEGYR